MPMWNRRFTPHATHADWTVFEGNETVCYVLDPKHARLIAAAPDLLAALQALTDWGRDHTSPKDPNSPHALLVAARAAIARATSKD
jgi:hypothetical protein